MLRPIASASLIALLLTAWTGQVLAEPRVVYTRHALKVDLRGLNLARASDLETLRLRLDLAADQVCNGRPDKGNRYTAEERKLLLPAYEKCHADAVVHALASLNLLPAPAQTASLPDTSP